MNIHPVKYKLNGIDIVANVYTPSNYDTAKNILLLLSPQNYGSENVRSCRQTSRPSMPGNPRSSTTTPRVDLACHRQRLGPGVADRDLEMVAAQIAGDHIGQCCLVVDDEGAVAGRQPRIPARR